MSPEDVERGYNNRAAVPDHPAWFARFASASNDAIAALSPRRDVRYGRGPKETLDLYLPPGRARGTFVFLHGGYWRAFDKSDHAFVAPPFVAQGLAVAAVNYDLCPDVSIATIAGETCRAIGFLARESRKLGMPATPIVIGGHSAGGHLAAMALATPPESFGGPAHPVHAAVSLSGLHDLSPMVQWSLNADFRLDSQSARALSPAYLAPRTTAPLFLAVGARETREFLRQSDLMWDAWPVNRPRGMVAPMRLAGRHHFSAVMDLADPESALTQATLALFG